VSLAVVPHVRVHRGTRERVYALAAGFWVLSDLVARVPIAASATVLLVGSSLWYLVRKRRAILGASLCASRDGDPDLVCRGNAWELQPLQQLNREFFEPIAVRSQPPWLEVATGVFVVPLAVGAYAWLLLQKLPISWAVVGAFFPVELVRVALRLIYVRYIRVSPGRLDVLSARPFRAGLRLDASAALAGAQVTCDYARMRVTIREFGSTTATVDINLHDVSSPHALVEAVFRGAVCHWCAPPLPRDELLG